MKKIYLLLLFFVMTTVHSQVTNPDKDLIVQRCLEFQPLIDKIPVDVQAKMKDFYILGNNFGTDFSQDLIVNGKKISFIGKADLSPLKPYFIFFSLNVDSDRAFVSYYFNYTTNGIVTTIPITVEFVKNNSLWQILKHTI